MKKFKLIFICFVFTCLILTSGLQLAAFSFAETKKVEKVTFNFVDVDLAAVTKFISEITGKNFIFDERLKGKVTIIAPSKLSIDEAYNLFTSVLELKGFTVIPSGVEAFKIIPASEAKQRGITVYSDKKPVNESYITRLIPLTYISADDALRLLQPFISKDGHVSAFGPGNLLLLVDSGLNIEKILSIVEIIDQTTIREGAEVVFLKYSSAEPIAKILNEGLGRRRGMLHQTGEEARAVAEQRLNAVVVFGDKGTRESMKGLISMLDVPSPEAQGKINVYFLENADATELAKVLDGMLKGMQTTRQPIQGAPAATPFESGGITITADKSTNSLVIVASPGDFQNLVQVIKQLDKKRRQVFVEAMIVEASIDKLRELGTKWRGIATKEGEPVFVGGIGSIDLDAVNAIISGLSGLTLGGMGNFMTVPVTRPDGTTRNITVPGFAALFSLSEFQGAINVLSTPQILTSDNKEAEIVVGENVPFITKREADPTRTASVFSTIERKDVGITLKLTPQITEGDYVKMDIYQEISSVKQEQNPNIIISVGPTTTKRATKTSVTVKDNQTVVIGGLMQEREEDNITKVPILGDIPLLGWLFKSKTTSKKKTNLLVFLTPHIVKEAEDLEKITEEKHKQFGKAENRFAENELLVRFREDVSEDEILNILLNQEAAIIKFHDRIGVYHIRLKKGRSVEDAANEFAAMPEVKYAEPNYRLKIQK